MYILVLITVLIGFILCKLSTKKSGVFSIPFIIGMNLIIYRLIEKRFLDNIISSIILFLISLIIFYHIKKRFSVTPPSFFLFIWFSAIPIIAISGYEIFTKYYGDYKGEELYFIFPLSIWYTGIFALSIGIYFSHIFFRHRIRYNLQWNIINSKVLLLLIIIISSILTFLSIYKISYIPILKGGIDVERFTYQGTIGEYVFKYARLWVVIFPISLMMYFQRKNNIYLIIGLLSILFTGIYGDRFYIFIIFWAAVFVIQKNKANFKAKYVFSIFFIAIIFSNFYYETRTGHITLSKMSFIESLRLNTVSEWREYAYSVNHFRSSDLLGADLFLSTVITSLPKQLWAFIGIDKMKYLEKGHAAFFKRFFGHYAGIRVGIIGEAFVSFNLIGVFITMCMIGVLFGWLEKCYLNFPANDPRQIVICFTLSILMFLPLAQSNTLTATFFLFLYPMLIFLFLSIKIKKFKYNNSESLTGMQRSSNFINHTC